MDDLKKIKVDYLSVEEDISIINALKIMDERDRKLLLVFKNNLFRNIISIGDIQRSIIKNVNVDKPICEILRSNTRLARDGVSLSEIKDQMVKFRMELLPVVDLDGNLVDVHFWEDHFVEKQNEPASRFNLPVVVMAGGLGSRLKPLTNVLPKPLIPIGEKTMLEEIFERFGRYGCDMFYISVNYKAKLIEFYLRNQKLPYDLTFFKEEKPMGTAGSLSLLKGQIKETFFVSNCDILIEQDYSEILDYHRANNNEITVVAALKTYPIAYGTIETGENGRLLKLVEKPELTFKINSGMYILEPHLLNEIPSDQFFHITHLIDDIIARNGTVGVFPVSEKSWMDIGSWEEYTNYIQKTL